MTDENEIKLDDELYEEILKNTYSSSYVKKTDRMPNKALVSLVKSGHAMFLFLEDDEMREYWTDLAKAAKNKIARRKEAQRKYEIKMAAYQRLSEADRKALKIRKPVAPRI